jgi:hypothetical protein
LSHSDIARFGEDIAVKIWNVKLVERGSDKDRSGVDGYLDNGLSVQIKADQRITKTGNLYHEIYEKSIGHYEQAWRHSPNNAQVIIFVTNGVTYKVNTDDLAVAENGLPLTQISETSMGFLLSVDRIRKCEKKLIMGVAEFY